ncbi:MAG TPA: DUF1501 domain-containing protein [Kofleriaceae bacterium]
MTKSAHLDRRQLLWGGGLAMLASALPFGRRTARAAVTSTPKNFICVTVFGGWDTTYALDPKPFGGPIDVPAGAVAQFGDLDIFDDGSRPNVRNFFTRFASITTIVRGIKLPGVSHDACMQTMLTGARDETSPDVAAMVANIHSPELPVPYLVLGDTAFSGPYAASMGRVGPTNQIVGLLDPTEAYPIDNVRGQFVPTPTDEAAIRAYTTARANRERAVRGASGYNKRRIDDFVASLDRGDRLRELGGALGHRGTQLTLAAQNGLALDAIQTGISRSVTLSSRLTWDSHDNNAPIQHASHEALFEGLTALIDDLATRPGAAVGSTMLDETVVAVISEMGRTPKLNKLPGAPDRGKDHWPVTSAMVIGAGIRGGRAFGATTNTGEPVLLDFATGAPSAGGRTLEANHFVAGLASACGIDPEVHFPEADAFRAFVA